MPLEVKVNTAVVHVTTMRLTQKVLNQIPQTYERDLFVEAARRGDVLGWVSGCVFDKDDAYHRWLVFAVGGGEYARLCCSPDAVKKYPHLYVA